jgi:hypothetical protein
MCGFMNSLVNNLGSRGLAFRAILLGFAVLLAFTAVGPVAYCMGSWTGVAAAAVAGALCYAGAAMALFATYGLREPRYAMAALLIGMAFRMGVPLSLGAAIHFSGGSLAAAGVLYYLAAFYPVTLTVETVLSLPQFRTSTCPVPAPSPTNTPH